MKKLPTRLKKYFWDTQASRIDVASRSKYVISRLMDYGNTQAVKWMYQEYGSEKIKETLKTMRGIGSRSAIFWAAVTDLPLKEVKCLQAHFPRTLYGV